MQQFFEDLFKELPALQAAWRSVLSLAIVLAAAGWSVGRFMFGQTIERLRATTDEHKATIVTLQERIKLKDEQFADLKSRLESSSPADAAKTIAELTARLSAIEPYGITKSDGTAMLEVLRNARVRDDVVISLDVTAPDASHLFDQVHGIFTEAPWMAIPRKGITGISDPPDCGVTLLRSTTTSDEVMSVLKAALNAARLDFEERELPNSGMPQIAISSRRANYVPKSLR